MSGRNAGSDDQYDWMLSETIDSLQAIMRSDSAEDTLRHAVAALSRRPGERAFEALSDTFDAEIRSESGRTKRSSVRSEEVLGALASALVSRGDEGVKQVIAAFDYVVDEVTPRTYYGDAALESFALGKALAASGHAAATRALVAGLARTAHDEVATFIGLAFSEATEQAIEGLVDLLREGDQHQARRAADALVAVGEPGVAPLRQALNHGEPMQQTIAVEALEELEIREWIRRSGFDSKQRWMLGEPLEVLLRIVRGDDPRVRLPLGQAEAVRALARHHDQRAFDGLIEAVSGPWAVSEAAARTLVERGDAGVDRLISIFESTQSEGRGVNEPVAAALATSGNARAMDALMSALSKASDADAPKIARAIARTSKVVVGRLTALVDTGDLPAARRAAGDALVELGQNLATGLRDLLRDGSDQARMLAADALGRLQDAGARDLLTDAARSDYPELVATACQALGEIGDINALPVLIPLSRSDEPLVRRAVAASLSKIDPGPSSIRALERMLDDSDDQVAEASQLSLTTIGEPAIGALQAAFQRNDGGSSLAAEALAVIGTHDSTEPLFTALRQADTAQRATAIFALRHYHDDKSLDAIAAGLRDKRHEIRRAAALSLEDALDSNRDRYWRLEPPQRSVVFNSLLGVIQQHQDASGDAAAQALANIGDAAIVLEGINHDSARVRQRLSSSALGTGMFERIAAARSARPTGGGMTH